jgi:hypothetical protein
MIRERKIIYDLTYEDYLYFNIEMIINKKGCPLTFCLICVLVRSSLQVF